MTAARIRGLWRDLYLNRPDIYDRFSSAEDAENSIVTHICSNHSLYQSRILDVGAGTGRFSIEFAKRGAHVLAVEPAPGMAAILLRKATESAQYLSGSVTLRSEYAESLQFEHASFDFVFLSWVLSEIWQDACEPEDGWNRIDRLIHTLVNGLAEQGVLWVVETQPGSYFGELQEELTGRRDDMSLGFADQLVRRFGFEWEKIPVKICFDSRDDAKAVCDYVYGSPAGDLILRKNGRVNMGVLFLSLRKS